MKEATIKTLFKNKWLSVREVTGDDGVSFVYGWKERSNGHDVAILPYRKVKHGVFEFLLRHELTPSWPPYGETKISSVTGAIEKDKQPAEMALIELKEETGYKVDESDLIPVGTIFESKAMGTTYHLYLVDLTDKEQGESEPDGELEAQESCFWAKDISGAQDPLVYVLYYRWQNRMEM